jgi:hypothetical protein
VASAALFVCSIIGALARVAWDGLWPVSRCPKARWGRNGAGGGEGRVCWCTDRWDCRLGLRIALGLQLPRGDLQRRRLWVLPATGPYPAQLGQSDFQQLANSETHTYAGSMPADACIGRLFTSRPTRSSVERVQSATRVSGHLEIFANEGLSSVRRQLDRKDNVIVGCKPQRCRPSYREIKRLRVSAASTAWESTLSAPRDMCTMYSKIGSPLSA